MQEILEKYKERLINISSRNRSLSMKKLYKKNSFDLFRLKKYYNSIDADILDFLISRNGSALKLIQDPHKWQEDKIKLCKKEIDEQINTKLNDIETEFTNLTEASIDTIDGLLKYLSNNDIIVKKQSNDSVYFDKINTYLT